MMLFYDTEKMSELNDAIKCDSEWQRLDEELRGAKLRDDSFAIIMAAAKALDRRAAEIAVDLGITNGASVGRKDSIELVLAERGIR